MPLQNSCRIAETGQEGITLALARLCDRQNADFRLPGRPDFAAERIGEQLMSEADAEKRAFQILDERSNGGFFCREPGILVVLPDILRAAHDHHEVVGADVRDDAAFVEFDGIPGQTVLRKEVAKDAGVFDVDVLQNEYLHLGIPIAGARHSGARHRHVHHFCFLSLSERGTCKSRN